MTDEEVINRAYVSFVEKYREALELLTSAVDELEIICAEKIQNKTEADKKRGEKEDE